MKIVYFSLTGQTRRFVNKLALSNAEITADLQINEPFILIVPTYSSELVAPVSEFLNRNHHQSLCLGIAGNGNRNFADAFIHTAKRLAKEYQLPLLFAFEFSGTNEDVANFTKVVNQLEP
ncbi:protein involved in ribonucleotide reduction [Enterococcus sp. PF1-24]|uniref:class Ib ribonucleoside-diphosphate reductase assembly flavoprotein NrdI n=1 Tax=unclassified Enterococcus TaxID=2608891 RepID=UPI0024730DFD|nr:MULTISPECIES: class Ib ribonucleoside-diphosphate reductase assembly flavoprotein NrdI [unclassified Enterococcus]MDH6363560.1 protein involved in ribonucleotide reduction [Enterococcus sp. PFB1-1]MDH6400795.1 protein involved in ribonucleotide reduction [Enterococcus sp. PF1-24]